MSQSKTIPNPLTFTDSPIQTVLRQLASQENCDGSPYDQMMQAADYIDELEKGGWQPIESAPKDEGKILVFDAIVEFAVWEPEFGAYADTNGYEIDPTHWQPLPQPPTS